jgi:hypothetical protein
MKKPDLSSTLTCASFNPKQSDLVVIGAADSDWSHTSGLSINSEAEVLRTPAMVKTDWQRVAMSPKVVPCLRESLVKELGATAKIVSLRRVSFPHVATYTALIRVVIEIKSSTVTARCLADLVLIGESRAELTLMSFAPLAAKAAVSSVEVRLARILVSRVRA